MSRRAIPGVSKTEIQDATYTYAADAEASDAYAIALASAPTAYAEGQSFAFKANTANTGASSLNVNSLGAKTLKKLTDQDTVTGDIEAGSIVEVVYDGTNFQIVSVGAVSPGDMTTAVYDPASVSEQVVGLTTSQTLTNKRITTRVSTEASSATPTINTDNVNAHSITALATAITSMTTNLSGTPTNFQKLIIRILDDGTGRAITWGTSFQAMGVDLPTTTTASKVLTVGFIYDTVDSKWGCVAVADEA